MVVLFIQKDCEREKLEMEQSGKVKLQGREFFWKVKEVRV
jgi:hypothetical protein